MSWATISATQVLTEGGFSQDEKDALTAAGGTGAALADVLTSNIATVRGIIEASGAELGAASTIPDSFRQDFIAKVRWAWLIAFPNLTQLQTDARKEAADLAEERLDAIAKGERPVEPPEEGTAPAGGDYGSETKIQMRTSRTAQE